MLKNIKISVLLLFLFLFPIAFSAQYNRSVTYPIHLTETTTVPGGAPSAGRAKVWLRDDNPNSLILTNDTGIDVRLTSATIRGTITVGDVGGGTSGSIGVGGDFSSASKVNDGVAGTSTITVTWSTLTTVPIGMHITMQGRSGGSTLDNDIFTHLYYDLTATGVTILLEETGGVAQNITLFATVYQ